MGKLKKAIKQDYKDAKDIAKKGIKESLPTILLCCLILPIPFVIIHYYKKKKEAQKRPTSNHKYARDIDNQNR